MKRALMFLVVVLVVVLMLVGCAASGAPTDRLSSNGYGDVVFKVVDDEAGVVCWVYDGIKQGGIDCMPLSETELRR